VVYVEQCTVGIVAQIYMLDNEWRRFVATVPRLVEGIVNFVKSGKQ
jgi:hypothetical protein